MLVDNNTATAEVAIKSELDTEKSTINVDIFALIEAVSDPIALIGGDILEFQSEKFEFSLSRTRKSDGKVIKITNETPEGDRTNVTGNVLVKHFDIETSSVSGVIKMVFKNTLETIQKTEEDIATDENGSVTAICRFDNVPVTFMGDIDINQLIGI